MLQERHAREIAAMLLRKPAARTVQIKPVEGGSYLITFEDRRDGRAHVVAHPRDHLAWLLSLRHGFVYRDDQAVCGRCGDLHRDHDGDDEVFATCIPCQAELVEAAIGEVG